MVDDVRLPCYMVATRAMHKTGDISRDEPDLAWIREDHGDEYEGEWIQGYGFIHVRFPKATTRPLTNEEAYKFSGMVLDMPWRRARIPFDDLLAQPATGELADV